MKSVIQEASSIGKAIEQGWEKAGRPAEFTIKILEHPKRGFLGLSSQGAKVVIFFDEQKVESQTKPQQQPYINRQPHQRQQQSLAKKENAPQSKQQKPEQQKRTEQPRKIEQPRREPAKLRPLNTNKPKAEPVEGKVNAANDIPHKEHHGEKQTQDPRVPNTHSRKRRFRPKKQNTQYEQPEQHKQNTPAHGDRANKRMVD